MSEDFFKWWSSDDGMCRLSSRKGGQLIGRGLWGRGQFSGESGSCDFAVWELISGLWVVSDSRGL